MLFNRVYKFGVISAAFALLLLLAGPANSQSMESGSSALIRTFFGHTQWANSVAFSPDGRYVLSGSGDEGTLKLWDLGLNETNMDDNN